MSLDSKPQALVPMRLSKEHKAIYRALELNVTFIAYMKPGSKKLIFLADLPGRQPRSNEYFSIGLWNEPAENNIIIRDTIGADEFLANLPAEPIVDEPDMLPCKESTPELLYKGQVLSITSKLRKEHGGKTVLSRVICDEFQVENVEQVWLQTIIEYFKLLPNTFRYVYFTPATGAWIGASPELLINANTLTGDATTMALAGTRRKLSWDRIWDDKNHYEHELVLDFIVDTLNFMNIPIDSIVQDDVTFNDLMHFCHVIKFNLNGNNVIDVIEQLSPTPAFSGMPREEALSQINHLELHDRKCYGGYIMHSAGNDVEAYVNLRCVHFNRGSYCIYTGGGITPDSKPEDEWKETEQKIEMLNSLIYGGMKIKEHFDSLERNLR